MPYRTKGQHKRSHEQPSGAEGVDPCRPQGNALTRPHRASNGEFVDDVTGPSTEAAAGVRAATRRCARCGDEMQMLPDQPLCHGCRRWAQVAAASRGG